MATVTILDDYQQVALDYADWADVAEHFSIDVVTQHLDGAALIERVRDSEIIVAMRERAPFPRSVLAQLPALRLLVTTGMSNAAIDLAATRDHGIIVCGTASGSTTSVPELTIGMIIALARRFTDEHNAVRDGGWQHTIGRGLAGATLGVVGLGRLGAEVARLALAFNMRVVAWSPHLTEERALEHSVELVSKQRLFSESDFISIHMRSTPDTEGIVAAQEFDWMKPSSYILNTSRGQLIEESALIEALRTKRIAGAGLDVYDQEPLPENHALRTLPGVLLLPHIGYVTDEVYRTFFTETVENIRAYRQGRPVRVLNA